MRIALTAMTAVAFLTWTLPSQAAEQPGDGVLSYQPSFFADARPNTAYDMVGRLPGFSFNDGDSARGFAGTAGNVLIDGRRPTSKDDDLQSILTRIPASDVDHIEVIRGGAPGIDMQGHTVIANIVRKKADSTHIVLKANNNFWPDGHMVGGASVEMTHRDGDKTFEAALSMFPNYDDSVGKGHRYSRDVGTGIVTHSTLSTHAADQGYSAKGSAALPLLGGQFRANLTLQTSPFHSSVKYNTLGTVQLYTDASTDHSGELGLHWDGKFGGVEVESLFLQRLGNTTDKNVAVEPGSLEIFTSDSDTGESIFRTTARYSPFKGLMLESGAEGAFNYLDGQTAYEQNGVPVPLPSANARVEERRGEAFLQGTWNISSDFLLEAGARFEYSKISETGATSLSRSFFYPKPRAVLTWSIDKETQLRARYEKVVGQLDFGDFIATSDLSSTGVSAGNPDLKPDQRTQYELSFEHHFWDKGAIVLTLMHEDITDVTDLVPIYTLSGAFDAPGNIGNGKNDKVNLEMTLPLDRFGITGGLLKASTTLQRSRVHDPVTGLLRGISRDRPQDISVNFTQDIESLKSTWGVFWYNGWDEYRYRLSLVQHYRVRPPYMEVFWEYKPTPDWSLRFEVDNAAAFQFDREQDFYSGPRDISPLVTVEHRQIQSQPRLYVSIRKTFN